MGTVWTAHDEVVDRDVAVKEPRIPEDLSDAERATCYRRMRREARAAARIDHPSVVTVHDVVVEEARPWIVMELVRGRSLGDQLVEGTLDPREAARIGLAVLGALSAAHEAGVLHRDVKPENVLLGRYDRVVLTDFGIAQVEGEQRLTETGVFVGSPEFVAPERVLGQQPGPESDLWSLGVVLYAAVEGISPFRRANTPATLQAVLSAEPQAPARGSGALGTLIMQLLRKDPAARPTAAEARQTLHSVAGPPLPPTALPGTRAYGGGSPGGGRLRTLRSGSTARFAVSGGVLVAALAALVVFGEPFASDRQAPGGWRTYDLDEQVKASIAVPGTYVRDDADAAVGFNDPSKVFGIRIERKPGVDGSAAAAAQERKRCYTDFRCEELTEPTGHVRWTTYQGRKAAQMTTTYKDDADSRNIKDMARREFFYVNENSVSWHLAVQMPAKGDAKQQGEKLFDDVVAHLQIKDL
jgi:tRNA A-37 threonylcarbamoyl transferase component Bud32